MEERYSKDCNFEIDYVYFKFHIFENINDWK